ncbi:alpha/beta fold hydrolase [Aquirufa regiilacus]|jgi:pimeloyl-ACP methyl ester carboxylesterase
MNPSLVLLHGFGEDARIWDDFIPGRFSNQTMHIPNYADWSDCMTIAEYARKIVDTLPQEQSFILIGHSMGGYIALELAKQFPQQVQGIIMLHSTPVADSADKKLQRDKTAAFIQEHGSEKFIRSFVANLFAPEFVVAHRNLMEKLADRYVSISQAGLVAATLAMKVRADLGGFVQSANIPMLFVLGEKDPLIPTDSIVGILEGKAQHKYVILSAVAHQGCYEAPEETYAVINQFINEIHA